MKKYLYLLACSTLLSSGLHAENIHLVKDMNERMLQEFKECNGMLYYSTYVYNNTNPTTTSSLWKSDGSMNGTQKVATFREISALNSYNNKLYFIANDSSGNELWVSDGTAAGTHMVKDINPGHGSAFSNYDYYSANQVKILANKMFFVADDGTHGRELWVSDGSDSGTHMVADINTLPGRGMIDQYGNSNYFKASFEVFNNELFFYANDSNGHDGLWTYDGISAAPVFIKSVYADNFMINGNRLFFNGTRSDTAYYATGLWQTDGTAAGTVLIKDFVSPLPDYAVLNGDLYFHGRLSDTSFIYRIYKTDGTAQGTIMLKDSVSLYNLPVVNHYNSKSIFLTAFNNKVYFGYKGLWATDGTIAGTQSVYNNTSGAYMKQGAWLTVANNKMYFKMSDSSRIDIWSTDGTTAGTQKIVDPAVSYPVVPVFYQPPTLISPVQLYNSNLYFFNRYDTAVGTELYRMDFNATSIKTVNSLKQLPVLYPNPAGSFIAVNDADVISITVYDITGKKLLTSSGQKANISGLQQGIYIAETLNDKGIKTTSKFMKQ